MHPIALIVLISLASAPASAQGCDLDKSPCSGCGCKGGPGYRHVETQRCVGFRQLDALCGSPPTARCVPENAPGTGENRDCALRSRGRPARGAGS
jgi:hypothetical protein